MFMFKRMYPKLFQPSGEKITSILQILFTIKPEDIRILVAETPSETPKGTTKYFSGSSSHWLSLRTKIFFARVDFGE